MPDINVHHALYSLILGVVFFISCFVLIVHLLPPEMYNPYKNYVSMTAPSDISGGQFNAFSYVSNFTLTEGTAFTKVFFNTTEIWSEYFGNEAITHEANGSLFNIRHFEWSWWIIPTHHDLQSAESIPFEYNIGGLGTLFSDRFILRFYDNMTDSATFRCSCSHITLKLTFTSNSSSYTLPEALKNRAVLRVLASWSYDFSAMGMNVWMLLGQILTFQTIATGVSMLDGALNSLISVPIWTAIVYIAYKLIAGLVPFISGGSGD